MASSKLPKMASSKLPKMAPPIEKRDVSPIFQWIREKLTFLERTHHKSAADIDYKYNQRWAFETVAKTPPLPELPGGVHHRLYANYYTDRDGRRSVVPPKSINDIVNAPAGSLAVSKGPAENFGLSMPTPGFGAQWSRNIAEEQPHLAKDPQLKLLETYDRYMDKKR